MPKGAPPPPAKRARLEEGAAAAARPSRVEAAKAALAGASKPPAPKKPATKAAAAPPARGKGASGGGAGAKRPRPASSSEEDDDEEDEDFSSSGTESDDLDLTRPYDRDSDEEDDDEGEDDDSDDDSVINVEFEFFDPVADDYKAVRRHIEKYLPGEEDTFNASGMADAVVEQSAAGTMIKVGGDPDAYGFATVLPLNLYRDTDWCKSIRSYLLSKAPAGGAKAAHSSASSGGLRGKLERLWDDPESGLGLLVSERVMNMPPELAPAIYSSLSQDLEWASSKGASVPPATRAAFAGLKQLLIVSPCFAERKAPDTVYYLRFEEELFAQWATLSYSFPVALQEKGVPGAGAAASSSSSSSSSAAPAAPAKGDAKATPAEGTNTLRPPQSRRVVIFGLAGLAPCVEAMGQAVHAAEAAAAAEGAAAVPVGLEEDVEEEDSDDESDA